MPSSESFHKGQEDGVVRVMLLVNELAGRIKRFVFVSIIVLCLVLYKLILGLLVQRNH